MEPKYYWGMEVEVTQECKGARYQNMWYINQREQLTDNEIQFYIYWDVLHDVMGEFMHLTEEEVTKYWQIA